MSSNVSLKLDLQLLSKMFAGILYHMIGVKCEKERLDN